MAEIRLLNRDAIDQNIDDAASRDSFVQLVATVSRAVDCKLAIHDLLLFSVTDHASSESRNRLLSILGNRVSGCQSVRDLQVGLVDHFQDVLPVVGVDTLGVENP